MEAHYQLRSRPIGRRGRCTCAVGMFRIQAGRRVGCACPISIRSMLCDMSPFQSAAGASGSRGDAPTGLHRVGPVFVRAPPEMRPVIEAQFQDRGNARPQAVAKFQLGRVAAVTLMDRLQALLLSSSIDDQMPDANAAAHPAGSAKTTAPDSIRKPRASTRRRGPLGQRGYRYSIEGEKPPWHPVNA